MPVFNGQAEEAANFYVSLLPDSRIDRVQNNVVDGASGKAGTAVMIEFTLAGQNFLALNGGVPQEYTMPSRSRWTAPTKAKSTGCGTL
jgi:predicted 3-demethylubiquinone-9 3-methyltransferase (glyoxalase superfamily)